MRLSFAKPLLAFALLAAGTGLAGATDLGKELADEYREARSKGARSTLFTIDNDSLLLNRDDGFYSSGLKLEQQFVLPRAGGQLVYGWRIGQELYTASDINLPPNQISPLDHPYAGWLYAGGYREEQRADGSFTRYGFDLGCLGPCAGGRPTQTALHRLINQPLPQGWSSQVKNELGLVLMADVAPVRWTAGPGFDLTPVFRARLGNIHTDAAASLVMRLGQLDRPAAESSLFGFLRADARLVGYNATLQGGAFSSDSPHTVDPKRLVGELELGAEWRSGSLGLRASVIRRGNEIKGLENAIGAQNFVRLQFLYSP